MARETIQQKADRLAREREAKGYAWAKRAIEAAEQSGASLVILRENMPDKSAAFGRGVSRAIMDATRVPAPEPATDIEFVIMGTYNGRTEEIDTAETAREARRLVSEYAMAFGAGWSFEIIEREEQNS